MEFFVSLQTAGRRKLQQFFYFNRSWTFLSVASHADSLNGGGPQYFGQGA
jgi:hypothetical protein